MPEGSCACELYIVCSWEGVPVEVWFVGGLVYRYVQVAAVW